MQGLFSSLADKAQSALNQTPLGRTTSNQSTQGGQSPGSSILKSHAFESIHHQLRSFQQQYSSSVTPVQKIITTQKGLALDLDSVSRDAQAHSKELYMWGQTETEDLKDVSDRLAWLAYIEGSLAAALAKEIDASRAPIKALRDAENSISGRRNIRASFENQIARIEHDQRHGMDQKLAELKSQLRKAEADDEPLEKEIELLKRKALRESETAKWNAVREYAEKLSLVAQAATAAIPALPDIPSSKERPYTGAQLTASVRATLQQALDHWTVGDTQLKLRDPSAADLNRSDTRSFGVTHAQELARINSADPHAKSNIPVTPPATSEHPPQAPSYNANAPNPSSVPTASPQPTVPPVAAGSESKATPPPTTSPPLNPANLNQTPAPIPARISPPSVVSPDLAEPAVKVPIVTPTVAETGVPQSAGPEGPGPASGSLKDIKHSSPILSPISGTAVATADLSGYGGAAAGVLQPESAEEEKRRLEREERERLLRAGGSAPATSSEQPTYESAEEEKRRLEREERERLLAGGPSNPNPDSKRGPPGPGNDPDADPELPPYQEF
ncbi:Eisosome component PIL1-domain-containing protein [Dichomitus squalens]|uniref:Eisosome component PIL1-domain-containing protein n=1 Tax=Dichomitus squalens TaxID=114155 RepID=A0A4Q9N241_9APHY|nr:Eisosome component PIL1-domain-containing protein [Dichomitus squalens]